MGAQIYYSYDKDSNTTTIRIVASFAVYGAKGQDVSKKDRQAYARMLKASIESNFDQKFTVNGRNFVMSAEVSVETRRTEAGAIKSGADNIVELGFDEIVDSNGDSADAMAFRVDGEAFDRMAVRITSGTEPASTSALRFMDVFSHEFGAHTMQRYHNLIEPASLFSRDGGYGVFTQLDFEEMFREHVFPKAPPLRGIPTPDPLPFSDVLKSIGRGGEYRRSGPQIHRNGSEVFKWVKRTKS
jgi:hypothetical protein